MTGVHSYAIASATAAFAGRTRRQIAVWSLPFVFLLHHQLPRSHQCGIRGDWHGARPGVRRARVRPRHRHFLSQLRGLTDPWRNAGSTVERALANVRPEGLDLAKIGTRKTVKPAIDKYRSGTLFSHCAPARDDSLSSILHWVQRDFLVADYSQKPIGTFRCAGRLVWRCALRRGALRAMLLNGWHSDKERERRWHAAFPF